MALNRPEKIQGFEKHMPGLSNLSGTLLCWGTEKITSWLLFYTSVNGCRMAEFFSTEHLSSNNFECVVPENTYPHHHQPPPEIPI